MKTIKWLNEHWWYRALKVVYITFLILCYSISIASVVGLFSTIRHNETSYENDLKDRAERMEFIQKLKNDGYSTAQISNELNQKFNRFGSYGMLTLTAEEFTAIYGPQDNVEVKPLKPEFPASMMWLVLFIPLSIISAWLVSELPRRIFYYVVLGSIRPTKQ